MAVVVMVVVVMVFFLLFAFLLFSLLDFEAHHAALPALTPLAAEWTSCCLARPPTDSGAEHPPGHRNYGWETQAV